MAVFVFVWAERGTRHICLGLIQIQSVSVCLISLLFVSLLCVPSQQVFESRQVFVNVPHLGHVIALVMHCSTCSA